MNKVFSTKLFCFFRYNDIFHRFDNLNFLGRFWLFSRNLNYVSFKETAITSGVGGLLGRFRTGDFPLVNFGGTVCVNEIKLLVNYHLLALMSVSEVLEL